MRISLATQLTASGRSLQNNLHVESFFFGDDSFVTEFIMVMMGSGAVSVSDRFHSQVVVMRNYASPLIAVVN